MTLKSNLFVYFVLLVVSFTTQWTINQLNIQNTKEHNIECREGETIITADDYSYLNPVENYITNGIWKESKSGDNAFYQRSPGYGLFCYPFLKLEPEKKGFFYLKIIQTLLQSTIPILIFICLINFGFIRLQALLFALVFGILPAFNGFVFYTLTEGITPFLVTLSFFLAYYSYQKNTLKNIIATGIVIGWLILTRPVFGLLGLLFIPIILKEKDRNIKYVILAILMAASPIMIWQIRNYSIHQKITNLHPIYSPSNNSVYRIPHQSIYNLIKQFNPEGARYHQWINKLQIAANQNIHYSHIHYPLDIYNSKAIELIGTDTLDKYTNLYYQSIIEIPKQADLKQYSSKELLINQKFNAFKNRYTKEHWLESNVLTPITVFTTLVFHSNLNLYQFQHTYRGNPAMEILRWVSLILHVLIFVVPIILILLFYPKLKKELKWLLPILVYLIYLCYFQRGVEERYTYPLLGYLYLVNLLYIKKSVLK